MSIGPMRETYHYHKAYAFPLYRKALYHLFKLAALPTLHHEEVKVLRLIMLGPPSAGKGTQSEALAKEFCTPKISTGDILRQAVKSDSPLGEKVRSYLKSGLLVPDEVIVDIVKERLKEKDALKGFILDGFPRTIGQAESLKIFLEDIGESLDAVVDLEVDDGVLIERFSGRRVCEACGATFHIDSHPPEVSGVCDMCKGVLIQREDDKVSTVKQRIEVYHKNTEPLIGYYSAYKLILRIDASQDIDTVFYDIKTKLQNTAAESAGVRY